jgi:predicted MFS family arabinose efflux permease
VLGPVRSLYALRPGAPVPLLLAAVSVTAMFGATPFLIPVIAERYGVTDGFAAAISVVQVGVFALVTLTFPRWLAPSGSLFRLAGVVFLVANVVSAGLSDFSILLVTRGVAGGAAGVLTWITWADAMRTPRSLAAISSVGPLTALVAAPVLAGLAQLGDRAVYLALALVSVPVALLTLHDAAVKPGKRQVSGSRSNRILLFALFLLTLFGTSMFVFEAVAARDLLGLSPVAASLGFSLNAAGGLLGARLASRHRRPGWWVASIGPAVFLSVAGGHPAFFFIGMAWWGFSFWMGVPGVLQMLADRSNEPGERAGDSQGYMAIGRTIGPAIGGAFVDASSFVSLAAVAAIGITVSGGIVMAVEEGRDNLPPTAPPTRARPGSDRPPG